MIQQINKKIIIKFFSFIILIFFLLNCKGKVTKEIVKSPPVPEIKYQPVDYVFILDNSGSIPQGEPRIFAKEAIKAFVELCDINDKISIIIFDENARLIANRIIRNQNDRDIIEQAIEQRITFRGRYTDISTPFLYLVQHKKSIFRGEGYSPVIIFISDGKLEPKPPKSIRKAYNSLMNAITNLSEIPFYTIGLGNKAIYEKFLPEINGFSLLRDKMAIATGGEFYYVQTVDKLIETYFKILRFTKGASETKERYIFWIDESTERISTLLIKRTPNQQICRTKDIFITDPKGRIIIYTNYKSYHQKDTHIRWQKSQFYDLIIIDKPFIGEWKIGLRGGKIPKIISILKTRINLRYKVKKEYWNKEKKIVLAWLYDDRINGLSKMECEIRAKWSKIKNFSHAMYVPLKKAENDIYLTQINTDIPGEYFIQFIAENKEKYFYRITEPYTFKIKESFFSFLFPKKIINRWTFGFSGIEFKAILNTENKNYPPFQEIPQITIYLEKIDEKGNTYPLPPINLTKNIQGRKIIYTAKLKKIDLGNYIGYFKIKGFLNTGENIVINSEDFSFSVKRPIYEWIILGFILFLILISIIWLTRPRLRGSLQIISPYKKFINFKTHPGIKKSFKGDYLIFGKRGGELKELNNISFTIFAKWWRKKVIEVNAGQIELKPSRGTSILLSEGNKYTLSFNDIINFKDNGKNYQIKVI